MKDLNRNREEEQVRSESKVSILKDYYSRYLIDIRGLKKSTVNHYFDALNNISRKLKSMGLVQEDIYEIGEIERLSEVREILFRDEEFKAQDKRGNQMYSAGLNNYYRFACGDSFSKLKDKVKLLDMPIEMNLRERSEVYRWQRSEIIKTQSLELAGYKCELDSSHQSFIAEKTKKPYMEGHHAIPLRHQTRFSVSLDIYANIVCLCPTCHRRLHYGIVEDRFEMMSRLYEDRSSRLAQSGIYLSKEEFAKTSVL